MTNRTVMANVSGELQKPASFSVTSTGSTTARSLANRFSERVNVKDFGAVGDGITNDTAAINAAAAYLTSIGGGILYFPRGTYLKNSGEDTYTNISFLGDGHLQSTVRARSQITVTSTLFQSYGNNLFCSGLTLDCNWQNIRVYNGKINAIELYGNNPVVSNCRVINFGGCIQTAQESFPVITQGLGSCVEQNIIEQPVAGIRAVFTGSISGTTLTVTSVESGVIGINRVSEFLTSSGSISSGTLITAQLTGTPNGAGTYTVNISQNRSSATISQLTQGSYSTFVNMFSTEGAQAVQAITSSDSTANTITVGGSLIFLINGDRVMFTAISGGSPLAINTPYYVINKNGNTFQLSSSPNGSAIDFNTITSASMGSVTVGGVGRIVGNVLKGTFEEGVVTNYNQPNEYLDLSFGIIGGSGFDTLIVKDNIGINLGAAFNGDSWHNGTIIIENNYFKNCQRGINLTYLGNSPDPRIRAAYIRNNVIRTTANALIGGASGRFENVDNIFVENNYLDTWDDSTATQGAFYFKNNKQAVIKNNIFHSRIGMGSCIDTGVQSWVVDGNTDENGIQRYEYHVRANSCTVRGNKSELLNGLELGRAINAARSSVPNYVSRNANNRFTVYIDSGNYDLNGYSESTSGTTDFNNVGYISLVGTGHREGIRIKHSESNIGTINISNTSPNISVKNLTLVAANAKIALYQSANSTVRFENVIFDKEGTGVIVPDGQFQHLATFVDCYTEYPFHGSNLQGNFGGQCYNCRWLGGFSTVPINGTSPVFQNCIIVGRLFTASGSGSSNVTMENCRIYAATGTANQNILLGSNCLITNTTFKNSRLVFSGSDNEVYNCTFNVDAGQSNCIAEASGETAAVKIFNVGSNKPIDANVSATFLTELS